MDTSPLIALGRLERLDLLVAVFDHIVVPGSVWAELTDKPDMPEPKALERLERISFELRMYQVPERATDLGRGEQHVLAIAYHQQFMPILDERPAQRIAEQLNRIRSPNGAPLLDTLEEAGFRLTDRQRNEAPEALFEIIPVMSMQLQGASSVARGRLNGDDSLDIVANAAKSINCRA